MSDVLYWIWLQHCIGCARCFDNVLDYFGSIEAFYESNYLQKKCCPELNDNMIRKSEEFTLNDAKKIVDKCKKNGWSIITYEDSEYPVKLKNIYNPPAVLYVSGNLPDIDNVLTFGSVGTRKASPYALKASKVIAKGVARCGGVVVSGGALGIDTASHEGALEGGGKTVAVLGCGLGANYLMSNADLRRRIAANGALISEYPPGTQASKYTFPARNRIISGLSDAVFVAEAGIKSGSLITASFAADQGRDIFVLPSSIFDTGFNGTNKLIEDGAVPVTSMNVILSDYKEKYRTLDISKAASFEELLSDEYKERDIPFEKDEQLSFDKIDEHRDNQDKMAQTAAKISGNEKAVYYALTDGYTDIDSIAARANLDMKDVLMSLTMLELDGLAEAGIGKRYRKKQA